MIRILIICLLTALVKSRNCQLDHRSLKKLKSSVDETKDFLNNDLDSRSAIVFFGNAKSGKSTLVNYLIPNELTAVRDKYGSLTIQRNGPNSTGPIIGTSSTSYTKIPKKWSSKTFTEFSLWDLPGFEDNRGVSQKVLNSFYIKELLTKVKIAKIVLVVDHETFNEPYTHFFNLIEWVSTFFGDKFENIFESISVILTKVPHSSNEGNVDSSYTHQVMTKLQGNLKNMPDGQSKRFVEYLVKNENRIGLFMAPNKEGTVGEECDINIKEAINNSQNISNGILDTIKLSLDAESKSCLLSSLNQVLLTPYYIYINYLGKEIKMITTDILNYLETLEGNEKKKSELKRQLALMQLAYNEQDFAKKFNYLKNISDIIKQKIENYELQTDYILIIFLDGILISHGITEVDALIKIILNGLHAFLESHSMKSLVRDSEKELQNVKDEFNRVQIEGEKEISRLQTELINILDAKKEGGNNTFKHKLLVLVGGLLGAIALIFFLIF